MSNVTRVTALPTTEGIKDPQVRTFLDQFVAAWDVRSGQKSAEDGERFITLGEINGLATKAMVRALSSGATDIFGRTPGQPGNPTKGEINDVIDNLADSIRKSILFQLLGTELIPTDLGALRARIDQAIGDVGAAIIREEKARINGDEAVVEIIELMVARIASSEAAIANEIIVRAQKDNALAQAVNTLWANIGGNQALIQDGALAAVSPAGVVATKWNQVQAAAIDPNTGVPNSTIVRQELNSFVDRANGTFGSIYSVRTQISSNGQTVVGGFGLSAVAGAGSAQGPTIDFGVAADRFWIASTTSTPGASGQLAQGNHIPFMVLTSYQNVNGVLYPPGVYLKKGVIGEATIGEAQIADLSVTNQKIGNVIQSNNFIAGYSGWRIQKNGDAEFNNVIIRRPSLLLSGVDYRSVIVSGQYSTAGAKGMEMVSRPVGSFIRGDTFYIETGFTDYDAIADTYAAGFYARVNSPSQSWIIPSGTGNVYELAFEATPAPAQTWGYTGTGGVPGQRIVIAVTPLLRVLKVFHSVQINNFTWALFRQR